jgi:hypothetical protein
MEQRELNCGNCKYAGSVVNNRDEIRCLDRTSPHKGKIRRISFPACDFYESCDFISPVDPSAERSE